MMGAMDNDTDTGLISPDAGTGDELDPETDPAWDWWEGMTVQDIVNGTGPAAVGPGPESAKNPLPLDLQVAKGDSPGHEFHGNQYEAAGETTWGQLKTGDRIMCPDGRGPGERVLWNRSYTQGKRAIRTSLHDHFKNPKDKVTLARLKERES
jgi:hypothetical protein